MCNHKWNVVVSYSHPYLLSKKIVCRRCSVCKEIVIIHQFKLTSPITAGIDLVRRPKVKSTLQAKTKVLKKVK